MNVAVTGAFVFYFTVCASPLCPAFVHGEAQCIQPLAGAALGSSSSLFTP